MKELRSRSKTASWAPVRPHSIASQIVIQVREALFTEKLKPGDLLGSEKELAAQFNVSRITIRDALRALETMGIVEIRVGASGGARIAEGNLERFADAIAIQFKLSGVTEHEILDLQLAIESTAIELAAIKRTDRDVEKLRQILLDSESAINKPKEFTKIGQKFHLALIEASCNRALVAQFKSLRHIIWPKGGDRATREIAQHVHKILQDLFEFVKKGNGEAARKLMTAHLSSIRAVAFSENSEETGNRVFCC